MTDNSFLTIYLLLSGGLAYLWWNYMFVYLQAFLFVSHECQSTNEIVFKKLIKFGNFKWVSSSTWKGRVIGTEIGISVHPPAYARITEQNSTFCIRIHVPRYDSETVSRLESIIQAGTRVSLWNYNKGNAYGRETLVIRSLPTRSSLFYDSIFLDSIKKDVEHFITDRPVYKQFGIPYRRGYLLYGPPGCGKSSAILYLAHRLRIGVCSIQMSYNLYDEELISRVASAPKDFILILEDFDRDLSNSRRHWSLSAVLNVLDGISRRPMIVVITTNNLDVLQAEPALMRPGRIDVLYEVKPLSTDGMARSLVHFFPKTLTIPEATELVEQVDPTPSSKLINICFKNRDDVLSVIRELKETSMGIRKREQELLGSLVF